MNTEDRIKEYLENDDFFKATLEKMDSIESNMDTIAFPVEIDSILDICYFNRKERTLKLSYDVFIDDAYNTEKRELDITYLLEI